MRIRWIILLALVPAFISCEHKNHALPDEQGVVNADQDLITPEVMARGFQIRSQGWTEPTYSAQEEKDVLDQYRFVDPNSEVPVNLLNKAILYYHRNLDLLTNKTYLVVVDFSKHSRKDRLFLINMHMGTVASMHVAHGKGSDVDDDGYAEQFGNEPDSGMSSLGFYVTGEVYSGHRGKSLRIDGLSPTNSNVRERAVVIHGAGYVVDEDVKQGRSLGCLAVSWDNRSYIIDAVKDGTLIYAGRSRVD